METFKGNMLLVTTWLAGLCFTIVWAHYYEGAFERAFDFYRKGTRKRANRQAVKMIGGISAAAAMLYYGLCTLLKYHGLPVFSPILIVLTLSLQYLTLSTGAVQNNVLNVIVGLCNINLFPVLFAFLIVFKGAMLDQYYLHMSAVLLVLCMVMHIQASRIWRRGDLI